jgi:hypothetical protein
MQTKTMVLYPVMVVFRYARVRLGVTCTKISVQIALNLYHVILWWLYILKFYVRCTGMLTSNGIKAEFYV